MRIGSPITGYGQDSRNRAARQRIPNKIYTDEDGAEHVEVNITCLMSEEHYFERISQGISMHFNVLRSRCTEVHWAVPSAMCLADMHVIPLHL